MQNSNFPRFESPASFGISADSLVCLLIRRMHYANPIHRFNFE